VKTVSDVLIKTTRPSAAFNFKFGSFHGRFISWFGDSSAARLDNKVYFIYTEIAD
jgi:hypothetical protein